MKVLWLSFTPAVSTDIKDGIISERGWITSLMNLMVASEDVTLGVVYFDEGDKKSYVSNKVHNYPIGLKYRGKVGKIYRRIFSKLYDVNPEGIERAIADFKPDVIHLFGTESGMTDVLAFSNVPVIVHLQGLVRPYLSVWYPKGMSQTSVYLNSKFISLVTMAGYPHEYRLFKKRAAREDRAIDLARFFFGRTKWDRDFISLSKKEFTYFHSEELLRSIFYKHQWKLPDGEIFKIISVINPQIYKGLEIVLETSKILNDTKARFEWHIVGISPSDELVSIIEGNMKIKFSENGVSFKGIKSSEGLISELLSSKLFVHPSHIENSPNSLCEAMLLGMPVIAGNVGGNSSIIENQKDGILYKSYEAYDLASLIKQSIEDYDPMLELGKNARQRALKRHNPDSVLTSVMSAYRQAIANF